MLKRCQVLLTDWLEEHIKLVAKYNDLSSSEMIRIILCEGILYSAPSVYPRCKCTLKIDKKLLADIAKEGSSPTTPLERKHQLTSKLYFEARKSIECLNTNLRKQLKNKNNNNKK